MTGNGTTIVLTADRTLLANYRVLLEGMLATSQTTVTPSFLMRGLLSPAVDSHDHHAQTAPLGLRRVEAALRHDGFCVDQVAVVPPEKLALAVGPATRIVGVSSGDPLGLGMNSNTMVAVTGGRIYTAQWFRELLSSVCELKSARTRVVMGGPGAWQLVAHPEEARRLGIDHVVTGCCESDVSDFFGRILREESLPFLLKPRVPRVSEVPAVLGPTVMGAVEISRGCGLGCGFCTQAHHPMVHFPVEAVLADARTNIDAGVSDLSLVTEDFFRYGSSGSRPEPEALVGLLESLRTLKGLRSLQPDHASVSSVTAFSDSQLRQVHRLLAGHARRPLIWINLGVETASGELLLRAGGGAKMKPFTPRDWPDVTRQQVARLVDAGFLPMVSLIMGLAGETVRDVRRTTQWVRGLRGMPVTVFPLFLASPTPGTPGFSLDDMTEEHWTLFRECYRFNFRWVPRLFADGQSRARVGSARRGALQLLGRLNVPLWKALFVLRAGRLRA